jgi:hypothetical protein
MKQKSPGDTRGSTANESGFTSKIPSPDLSQTVLYTQKDLSGPQRL